MQEGTGVAAAKASTGQRLLGWLLITVGGLLGMLAAVYAFMTLVFTTFGGSVGAADFWWHAALVLVPGVAVAGLGFTLLGVRRLLVRALLGGLVVATGIVAVAGVLILV